MAATDEFDLNGILSQLYRVGPTEDERRRAATQAMARMGLGILAANQPSATPRNPWGVLAQGGLGGMDAYQSEIQRQMQERKQGAGLALSGLQIKKQLQQQDALKGLASASQPTPLGPQALAAGAEVGDIGPTQTNLKRMDALEANPLASQYTPIPLDKLAAAAAGGVDISPFLKLNEAARPDVLTVDAGDELRLIDKKTLKILERVKKKAAPSSIPFELSDLTPPGARQFKIDKSKAGAPTVTVDTGAKPFWGELGKSQAEELTKSKKGAEESVEIINTVREGRKLLNAGMVTGFGAEFLVGFGQALKQAGVDFGGDATANSQAFSANMAQNVGKIIKQFGAGTGLSDADREYAEKMAGGKITLDEMAIRKILEINEKAARNIIALHNKKAKGVQGDPRSGFLPFSLTVDLPSDDGGSSAPEPRVRRYNPQTGRIE